MKILDATAGCRSIWYQKDLPFVTFMDKRNGTFVARSENSKLKDNRYKKIKPDIVSEWKDAPFPDESFDMIVFDPPHKIGRRDKKICSLEVSYGMLYADDWRHVLSGGINKLFKLLKPEGFFILKWCETDKPLEEILKLFPYKPLFGTRTGQKNMNHWVVFIKYRPEKPLC